MKKRRLRVTMRCESLPLRNGNCMTKNKYKYELCIMVNEAPERLLRELPYLLFVHRILWMPFQGCS